MTRQTLLGADLSVLAVTPGSDPRQQTRHPVSEADGVRKL